MAISLKLSNLEVPLEVVVQTPLVSRVSAMVRCASAATVHRKWEQLFAEHRRRFVDQSVHPATVERQVPKCSGQLPEEPANVRYGRPPTFVGQIPATANSLNLSSTLFPNALSFRARQSPAFLRNPANAMRSRTLPGSSSPQRLTSQRPNNSPTG
jgi:hypothetical protein